MGQDQQTFQRAANAAGLGLLIQAAVAVGVALVGLWAESAALHAATWHLVGGLPIWIILWVVYHQHRLERIETLETEQLARTDAQAATIFDEAGQQLQLARRRLDNLYRYGLNIVSLLIAAYLLAVGGALAYVHYDAFRVETLQVFNEQRSVAAAAILPLLAAFVAFLVARYVSGMTRVRQWTLLRGGASYLMGNAVVALLLTAAAGVTWLGNPILYVVLALVIPGFMVVLGVEMVLGFVLGIYRPRRPDQVVRPAFDSRILGWLTRPESIGKIIGEAVNYQFGFEISRSWFYGLLGKAITPLVIVGGLVLIGLSSLVIVAPHENAVIMTFGRFERVAPPGLAFKWPWPAGRAENYGVYRVHEIVVGSAAGHIKKNVAILWTTEHVHGRPEQYLLTAPTPFEDGAAGGGELTAGELVGADLTVKFRVDNLKAFVESAVEPARFLEAIAERCLNAYFVSKDIDTLLTAGRMVAGEVLRGQIQEQADAYGLGLEVVFAGLTGVHPPQKSEVAAKFHEQIDALLEKQSAIEDARKQTITTLAKVAGSRRKAKGISDAIGKLEALKRQLSDLRRADEYVGQVAQELVGRIAQQQVEIEKLLNEAGGEAAQLIYEARAYRWEHALNERARAMRTHSEYEAYRQAPQYYRARRFLLALTAGLKDRRKVIQTGSGTVRLHLEEQPIGLGGILDQEP